MDFMIAYFPMIKGAIGLLLIVAIYFSFKKKLNKLGFALLAFGVVFTWYSPVKIDGTNTAKSHKATERQRTSEYNSVTSDAVIVTTKKLTFSERMEAEELRSTKANQRVVSEIVK